MQQIRKIFKLSLLCLISLTACQFSPQSTQLNKAKDSAQKNDYLKLVDIRAPFVLRHDELPNAAYYEILLERGGEIKPLASNKKELNRVNSGSWTTKENKLILNLIIFNKQKCQNQGPCSHYSYKKISLPMVYIGGFLKFPSFISIEMLN